MYDFSGGQREKIQFWEGRITTSFPETVEHKSCTATIYSQKHRQAERFEVRYYDLDGSQQRLTFGSYSAARKFAATVVQELARNRGQFVTLRGPEACENQKASELLQPLGLSVLQAALA